MTRIRLDKLLVKRNMAENYEDAAKLISTGQILVNGSAQTSVVSYVDNASAIEYMPVKSRYVSRGGFKLEHALTRFAISPEGKRCLDIGASTGGFTDCLLQHGAAHVVALDVGHGQIDASLRNDDRVSVFEKTNARTITPQSIGGMCTLGVADVSFTSIIPLINPVAGCLDPVEFIALIKPQFECDQRDIDSRGVVTRPHAHRDCIVRVRDSLSSRLSMVDIVLSPIKGAKGNSEYLCLIVDNNFAGSDPAKEPPIVDDSRIESVVARAFETPEETHD